MTNDTTARAPAATLTEDELFEEFLKTKIAVKSKCYQGGFVEHEATELLADRNVFSQIRRLCPEGSSPSSYLNEVYHELSQAAHDVEIAIKAFEGLMAERLLLPEEPDELDEVEHSAWKKACKEAQYDKRFSSAVMSKPAPTPRELVVEDIAKVLATARGKGVLADLDSAADANRLLEEIEHNIFRAGSDGIVYKPRRDVWIVRE